MKWSIFVCLVVCLARLCNGLAIKCLPGQTDPSCTAERKVFNVPESNQAQSDTREAQCLPGSEWESNCHRCRCSSQGRAECLKQSTDCDKGVLAEPVLCKSNTTFQRDCNTCICLENGLGLCTLEFCRTSDFLVSPPDIQLASDNSEIDDKEAQKSVLPNQNHYEIENLVDLDHDMVIIKRSKICKPLEEFMRDCNPCKCASNGLSYSCTHNECLETEMDKDKEVEVFMQSEGEDHVERHSVCRASNTFYIGCNTCRCNALGTDYSCTNKQCPLPADVELFHELKTTKAPKNTTKSQVCTANRMFIKDCNTCWCNEDGTSYYCTRRVCVPLLPEDQADFGGIPADIMGRNKGEHYQCINKRKRNREGMARARQVLKERTFNQLDTTSSSTMSVEVDVGTNLRVIKKTCRPNEVFELDCNMCRCNPDGQSYACTRRACETQLEDTEKNATLSRKTRALTTEPPKACQPGQEFRLDCNKCLCDNKGQDFSCTRIDCNAVNNNHHASAFTGARSKRDTSEKVSMECVPGSVFDRDCNVCRCTESGLFATCTIKRCNDVKPEPEKAPESDQGFRCNPGEQFRRDCNDCTCSADGRSVFCTLRLCDETLTSDI